MVHVKPNSTFENYRYNVIFQIIYSYSLNLVVCKIKVFNPQNYVLVDTVWPQKRVVTSSECFARSCSSICGLPLTTNSHDAKVMHHGNKFHAHSNCKNHFRVTVLNLMCMNGVEDILATSYLCLPFLLMFR